MRNSLSAIGLLFSIQMGCNNKQTDSQQPHHDTGHSDADALPSEPDDSGASVTSTRAVPEDSPGVVLLMTQHANGSFTVDGTVNAELYVDTDIVTDDRESFRYQLLNADNEVVFERTNNGPPNVRAYLDHYSGSTDINVMESFPVLGTFSLIVPIVEGANTIRFDNRNSDGVYEEVGQYDLSQRDEDHVGTSDAVIGHQAIWSSADPVDALDIVLVGDGYTRDQMAIWINDATEMAAKILSTAPISQHKNRINIHRVDAVSNESGASYDCIDECRMRDTAFESIFAVELVNQTLGTNYSTAPIFQMNQWEVARAVSVVPYDLVLVVANTTRNGGMAVHYATVTKDDDYWTDTGVHELAHILGPLGDEYVSNDCIIDERLGLPLNISDDATNPPWSQWIKPGTPLPTSSTGEHRDHVGAFEGAYNCPELVRPSHICKMSSVRKDFCSVCTEALAQQVYQYADFVDEVNVEVAADATQIQVSTQWPDVWVTIIVDGAVVASGTADATYAVATSVTEVTVEAQLLTDDVRASDGRLTETFSYAISR